MLHEHDLSILEALGGVEGASDPQLADGCTQAALASIDRIPHFDAQDRCAMQHSVNEDMDMLAALANEAEPAEVPGSPCAPDVRFDREDSGACGASAQPMRQRHASQECALASRAALQPRQPHGAVGSGERSSQPQNPGAVPQHNATATVLVITSTRIYLVVRLQGTPRFLGLGT